MDWLAEKVLKAIEEDGNMGNIYPDWSAAKRSEYEGASRFDVLRWICFSLDSQNQTCVARALNVRMDDLKATGRVLHKI